MYDLPVDGLYLWLGVAVVSLAVFGVVLGLPDGTAPDARSLARAVDAVSVGPPGARGSHSVGAEQLRVGPGRIGLRGPSGGAHAAFAYGPVVPVVDGTDLASVLGGRPPSTAFDHRDGFAAAIERARDRDHEWRPAPDRIEMRRVSWGEIDVTLVG